MTRPPGQTTTTKYLPILVHKPVTIRVDCSLEMVTSIRLTSGPSYLAVEMGNNKPRLCPAPHSSKRFLPKEMLMTTTPLLETPPTPTRRQTATLTESIRATLKIRITTKPSTRSFMNTQMRSESGGEPCRNQSAECVRLANT